MAGDTPHESGSAGKRAALLPTAFSDPETRSIADQFAATRLQTGVYRCEFASLTWAPSGGSHSHWT
jgi:hypothetical protein